MKKHINSKSDLHRQRENQFRERIQEFLFDIAAADALETMEIQEDKDFLLQQRQKGRPGSMVGIDQKLAEKEKRKSEREEKENNRKQKYLEQLTAPDALNIDDDDSTIEQVDIPRYTSSIVPDLVLNRTSIQLMRKEYRRRQAHEILDNF